MLGSVFRAMKPDQPWFQGSISGGMGACAESAAVAGKRKMEAQRMPAKPAATAARVPEGPSLSIGVPPHGRTQKSGLSEWGTGSKPRLNLSSLPAEQTVSSSVNLLSLTR